MVSTHYTAPTLATIGRKVDQWLKPVGLTGFVDPLREVKKLVTGDSAASIIFMSDGHDNCNAEKDILSALRNLEGVASLSVVEYGYYANRPLLSKMAETLGGTYLFASGFDEYASLVRKILLRKDVKVVKKVKIPLFLTPLDGVIVGVQGNDIVSYPVEKGHVTVPDDKRDVFFMVPTGGSGSHETVKLDSETALSGAYALLSAFAVKARPDVIGCLLKATGDVAFIEKFSKCFGKQHYSTFMQEAAEAAVDSKKRLVKGYDPSKVPDPDAFTVIDLLKLLEEDPHARLLLDHEDFSYNRISRGRVDAQSVLSQAEVTRMAEITAEIATTRDKAKVAALSDELRALTSTPAGLVFKAAPSPEGYPLEGLTYNESKPNISILVKKQGTVKFSGEDVPHGIPVEFPTFVYRNYAIVKDGLINVKSLPLRMSKETLDTVIFQAGPEVLAGIPKFLGNGGIEVTLRLDTLPIINQSMVTSVKADHLFDLEYKLFVAQSRAKVFKAILSEAGKSKESASFVALYGKEGADWLKEKGFTEYSGFSPKMVQAESVDYYMAKEVKTSFKGLSSLPSLNDVRAKMASKKVNAAGKIMAKALEEFESLADISVHLVDPLAPTVFSLNYARQEADRAVKLSRELLRELAKIKFSIVVGQVWPFSSLDENTYTYKAEDGSVYEGKIELLEKEVKILV